MQRPLQQTLNDNPTFQSSSSLSASQLAGEAISNSENCENDSSNSPKQAKVPSTAGIQQWPEIVHEIYRHFPAKTHDQLALPAIHQALEEVDASTLLLAVKAFAKQTQDTNTEKPTWPHVWLQSKMWKSFLPLEEAISKPSAELEENDQNHSSFTPDFYNHLKL